MPAYRNRIWDGKIRLFNHRNKTLYCGLYNYLLEFAEEREYSIVNDGPIIQEYNEKLLEKTLKECTLTVNKGDITPRPYQLHALRHALQSSKSLLLSPTASGKSLIIYLAIRHFLKHNKEKL